MEPDKVEQRMEFLAQKIENNEATKEEREEFIVLYRQLVHKFEESIPA